MPGRFQERDRDFIYKVIADRDGEYCLICKGEGKHRSPPEVPLEIDHADSDSTNNDPQNLHLLCRACNLSLRHKKSEEHLRIIRIYSAKNERERARGSDATRRARRAIDYAAGSSEMKANGRYEVPFRDWVMDMVVQYKTVNKEDLVTGGAEFTGASTISTRRYLSKMLSPIGALRDDKDENGVTVIKLKYALSPEKKRGRPRTTPPSPPLDSRSIRERRDDEEGEKGGKRK